MNIKSIHWIAGLFVLFFTSACSVQSNKSDRPDWYYEVGARQVPESETLFSANDYGAQASEGVLNTQAIQAAIDACAEQGGGRVSLQPGTYLTGSIYLKSGVHLHLPKGVTLLGSTNIQDYPDIDTRVAGIEMIWPSALINVLDQSNVKISGEGIIDGQGKVFWDLYWEMRKDYETKGLRWIVDYDCKRPRTLLVSESEDVTIEGLNFQRAGFWTIQLLYSSHCTVDGVTVRNNIGGHGPSTDGIDIDSSNHILVENCDVDCNDDTYCLKAGRDADGLRVNRPTEYIVIRNNIARKGAALITCGSETSGSIRHVRVENMQAFGTSQGFLLKSALVRGGVVEDIQVDSCSIDGARSAFVVSINWNPAYSYSTLPEAYEGQELPAHWYKLLEHVEPASKGIPAFRDIRFTNTRVTNTRNLMTVRGDSASLIQNVYIAHIDADVQNLGSVKHIQNWTLENVRVAEGTVLLDGETLVLDTLATTAKK